MIPVVSILPIAREEYEMTKTLLQEHSLKQSDAIHGATALINKIPNIITEDSDFDHVPGLTRVWIEQ